MKYCCGRAATIALWSVLAAACSSAGLGNLPALEELCEDDDAQACLLAGNIVEVDAAVIDRDSSSKAKKRRKEASELYKISCEAGVPEACARLAVAHLRSGGLVPKNFRRSVTYHKLACDAGDALSCYRMGVMHETGTVAKRKKKLAYDFYRASCEAGLDFACEEADRVGTR